MNKLNTLVLMFCSSLIAGCGSVRPVINPIAVTHVSTNGMYEILLQYSITSSGGPCFNMSSFFRTWTSHDTNWLYVKSIEGVQTADQIVLKGGVIDHTTIKPLDLRYPIEPLRGTVSFTNLTMTVKLDQPRYDRKGARQVGYTRYYLNGTYTITTQ